jgi:potassium uptake protein, TrkH family
MKFKLFSLRKNIKHLMHQSIRTLHPPRILVIGFALTILVGALLLNLPFASQSGQSVGFVNSLFISTSAVCVTGLVVVDTATQWTYFGQGVILLLIQIGGLGFMTMGTLFALILGRKITLKERLIIQESLNQFNISGLVKLTQYILMMTFTIEGIGALILSTRFIPMYGIGKGTWFSIFHSISAFCNAGFDLVGNYRSLTPFVKDPTISLTIAFLIILGGLGFVVILELFQKRQFKKFSLHAKIVLSMTASLLSIGFILFLVLEYKNTETLGQLNFVQKNVAAFFQSVTPRTAGFNTIPIDKLNVASVFLTIVLMFIGGASGGTAGGVKITTVGVLISSMHSIISGKSDVEAFRRRIPRTIIDKSTTIVGLSLLLVIITTMVLSISEVNHGFIELFFETVSAFGTVGLSMGITPTLTVVGKLIITMLMFFGRVGPLTIFMALSSMNKQRPKFRYPEEKLIVG